MQDILHNILLCLPIKDIISCTTVNNFFNECCSLPILWQKLVHRDFNNTSLFKINYYETYKLCFKLSELNESFDNCFSIETLYNLEDIYLPCGAGSNPIISPEINQLCNLQTIGTKYQMKKFIIPPEIGDLHNLIKLNFDCCDIITLPNTLGKLHNLKICRFSRCKLVTIPTELGTLYSLEELHFANNSLTTVPTELGNLFNLQTLYLYNNKLVTIPKEFENLGNLRELDISKNNIDILPIDLKKLTKLTRLSI